MAIDGMLLPAWPLQINAMLETIGPIATEHALRKSGEARLDGRVEH